MNLYKISQGVNKGYDTYDSAIVAADSENEAKQFHPYGETFEKRIVDNEGDGYWIYRGWCKPEHVSAALIGKAADDIETGVVLASFNAG